MVCLEKDVIQTSTHSEWHVKESLEDSGTFMDYSLALVIASWLSDFFAPTCSCSAVQQ